MAEAGNKVQGQLAESNTNAAAATAAAPVAAPAAPAAVNLTQTAAANEPAAKRKLPPKRKVAMHLAYLGKGYYGMQRNPGYPTIEADLETALVKAGAISDQNAGSFFKIHWMRAARTDKGVSAACQVVSAKLIVDPPDTFADRVNAHLPQQVVVFGVQRATDGFDARKYCDKRKYEYILPAWVFDPQACSTGRTPPTETDALQAMAAAVLAAPWPAAAGSSSSISSTGNREASNGDTQVAAAAADEGGSDSVGGGDVLNTAGQVRGDAVDETASSSKLGDEKLRRLREDIAASKARFTFGPEQLQQLNQVLGQYVGTHNFHNYTVRLLSSDPASRRYIMSFSAELKQVGGEPWVKLVVVGQSFMLHQIRKMVGMAVAVVRGVAPPDCLKLALDPDRDLNTPMAPALGLFLDETYFDAYNKRFGELHGPVTFEPFRAAAEAFKEQVLYPDIADTDKQELVNALWLRTCTETYYKFSRWAKWGTVRNTAATIAANRTAAEANKMKRAAAASAPAAAIADGTGADGPASKHQRLDRPGRLQGATAAMVVASQETYGMSPHKDTPQASAARQELKAMREEYQQAINAEQEQQEQQQEEEQPQKQQLPEVDPAELDELYDII